MTDWKVPLFDLRLEADDHLAVQQVLDSNWLTMGQVTEAFEDAFSCYLGAKHAVATASATAAMHLAYVALGLKPGDEVICPALTFVATANAIRYMGATPVFVDVESPADLNLSIADVESKITDRTRAIAAVHYGGFPCNMDAVMEIARANNLFVVEDAAHAPGAEYVTSKPASTGKASKLGTIGDIGCFSFFGNKNMTTAEGGMLVTNDDEFAQKAKTVRSHGMTTLTWDRHKGHSFSYDVVDMGYNYRIDELRSSLGLAQLAKLDRNNDKRKGLWGSYAEKLQELDEIEIPFLHSVGSPSYHLFPLLLPERIDRQRFMEHLKKDGIQTSIHYPPVHFFSYYRQILSHPVRLPVTEDVGKREVTLPLFPSMTPEQVEYTVNSIRGSF